jgi:DivIVA domain-containing protein
MLTSAAVLEARFTVTRFREGYDQDEVTAFLQRAQAALAAWERGTGAPGLTGDDVVNQRFTPTKFDNGFDQDEVDVFLDRIVVALREHAAAPPTVAFVLPVVDPEPAAVAEPATVAEPEPEPALAPVADPVEAPPTLVRSSGIPDKAFSKTRFRQGYSVTGVDGFLAAARTVIAGYERPGMLAAAPALTAADVVNVRFKPTSFRAGYDQDEVAAYLTQIIETLDYYERTSAAR